MYVLLILHFDVIKSRFELHSNFFKKSGDLECIYQLKKQTKMAQTAIKKEEEKKEYFDSP